MNQYSMVRRPAFPVCFIAALALLMIAFSPAGSFARNDVPNNGKTLLIINSYNENAPWAKEMIRPVTRTVAPQYGVHTEIVYLNNILLTDSAEYLNISDRVFNEYNPIGERPSYVVMIGQLAFTFRDRIKAEWGDIPMLYITPTSTYGSLDEYFGGYDNPETQVERFPLENLRPEFNFTIVKSQFCYRETIELMHELLPRMNKLVFISDCVAINRSLNRAIKEYVEENYPHIEYQWLQARENTTEQLQQYFTQRSTGTGLLLSSWFYQSIGVRGIPYMSMGDMSLLSGSINPVFALRQAYMDMGAVGGVFPDAEDTERDIEEVIKAMLQGKSMRDLPFYEPVNIAPVLDFQSFERYGMDIDDCPDGTVFVNEPVTFWGKYKWQIIVVILMVLMAMCIVLWRNRDQASRIKLLERHRTFVDRMPIPFAKAKMTFNNQGQVTEINYEMMNEAFANILKANSYDKFGRKIFPREFISARTQEMLDTRKPVAFTYHFDKTNTDYDFMLCMVDVKKAFDMLPTEVDIFASEITERIAAEQELKELTRRFDTIINLAKLIPWRWDMKTDVIKFNAYSIFQREEVDVENIGELRETDLDNKDFISIIHPDDAVELKQIAKAVVEGKAKRFEVVYRMKLARDFHTTYREIEGVGVVYDTDADGKPLTMVGYIRMLDE